jgi:hypothetical protein
MSRSKPGTSGSRICNESLRGRNEPLEDCNEPLETRNEPCKACKKPLPPYCQSP